MNSLTLNRCTLSVCAAATLLVGCVGLQPAGVTQGPVPQGQMAENPSRVSGVRQSPRSVRHASVTETVLHSFRGYPYDGAGPNAGLTYFKGTLYGTTPQGGAYGYGNGTVYRITPSGTETVLHSFKGGKDGAIPEARMIVRNGTLYGTTANGGGKCPSRSGGGCGTVFSIIPSRHRGRVTVLHAFTGSPDGANPEARLLNVNGTLYGTTSGGGSSCQSYGGCGTVFSITPGGKEKVLYRFRGSPYDGAIPSAGLVDVKGTLYGTTIGGGATNIGTVFSITPGGKEKVLYSFTSYGVQVVYPSGLVDVSGTLYGTTTGGGEYSAGTVFSITPGGKEKVLHSFSCCRGDGFSPQDALLNVNGTLYGTTDAGGANGGWGTVFSITLSGHETVLYSFMGRGSGSKQDGADAQSGLNYVNGTFYGTTYLGGAYDSGTVYSITL